MGTLVHRSIRRTYSCISVGGSPHACLRGRKAAAGTRLVVYPASRSVLLQAISEGVIATLVEVGAAVCAPGCGFCIGRTVALGDGEAVLSTQNRNFKGRRGDNSAEIYLSSVETAAVSAIAGEIGDPRDLF